MKFKNFILESSERSKDIDFDTFRKLINTDYSEAFDNLLEGKIIYRGIKSKSDIFITEPKSSVRKSANTANYYTLIVDNADSWRDFPKRSQSIICSTSIQYASDYGYVYVVLPKNKSKIAICPADDFWNSFNELAKLDIMSLGQLNDIISLLFDVAEIEPNDDDLNSFKKTFNELIKYYKDFDLDSSDLSNMRRDFLKKYIEIFNITSGDPIKTITSLLDPEKNGFKIEKISQFNPKHNREVYTDGDCIMIKMSVLNKLMDGAK